MRSITWYSKVYLSLFLIIMFDQLLAGTVTIQYDGSIVDDARITSGAQGYNGGGDIWGNVTFFTSNYKAERTYFRIPIPSFIVPQYADSITHATLKLYFSGLQSGPFEISIHEVLNNWGEYSIAWYNKPNHSAAALDTVTLVQEDVWIDFTITELVKEWVSGEKINHGIVVKPLIEAPPVQDLSTLLSSDYPVSSLRPILEISAPQLPDSFITSSATYIGDNETQNNYSLSFELFQNYPNPFNPETTISYQLPAFNHVKLTIYNLLGEEVKILVNEEQTAGEHSVIWDGTDNAGKSVSSGVYIYRIQAGSFVQSHKMALLK